MADIKNKVTWLLLIAPGLISLYLAAAIYDFGNLNEFGTIFYGLALTFFNVVITFVTLAIVDAIFGIKLRKSAAVFVGALLLVSLVAGVSIGVAADRDVLLRSLRAIPWSDTLNRRSNARPLDFLFTQNSTGQMAAAGDGRRPEHKVTEAWIRIQTPQGIFEGWPEFWGDSESHVYLSPACRIIEEGRAERVEGPGVILPESGILVATFLDRDKSPCFVGWESLSEQENEPAEGN